MVTFEDAVWCIPPHVGPMHVRISWLFGSQNIQIF